MQKREYVRVGVGDVVRVDFDFRPVDGFTARITEILRNFGGQPPRLRGVNVATGEETYFDNSYVVEVVKRSLPRGPYNQIAGSVKDAMARVQMKGPLWSGFLVDMAVIAVGQLPFAIDRPIDDKRLTELFRKEQRGVVRGSFYHPPHTFFTVRKKAFKTWIRQNWSRILVTVAECEEAAREEEEDRYREFSETMDAIDRIEGSLARSWEPVAPESESDPEASHFALDDRRFGSSTHNDLI